MQDSGHDLWSQGLCSDTISVTPPALRTGSVTFT